MTGDELIVLMDGIPAGRLRRTQSHHRFAYDDAYSSVDGATPISVSMPLAVPQHTGPGVTAWLWGLLPEDDDVIARWAREHGVSKRDVFALLGTPIGRDCAGAVQFAPEHEADELSARRGSVAWLTEHSVAERLVELRRDKASWHGVSSHPGQFSLAGAQSKIALVHHEGRWGEPSGSIPTTHIIKPGVQAAADGTRLDDQALNEHLCLSAARIAGLRAAATSIMRFGNQQAIVVERYDRTPAGARPEALRRVHQEDACQAIGVMPESKYETQGGPGVAQIGSLLRSSMPRSVAADASQRFLDALAFNWLIGGTDAHAKNYSLLLSGPEVRLAPLYDVASSFPYWHPRKLRLAMKLGGDDRVWPWVNRWPAVAAELGLDVDIVHERVSALCERAPNAFERAAESLDPEVAARPVVERLVDDVAAQCRRCSAILQIPASG